MARFGFRFAWSLIFGGDGGLLFHFILSKITVLGRIVKKFRAPSPQIKEGKMARFAFRVASSFFLGGGGGGLLFHFILSKTVERYFLAF